MNSVLKYMVVGVANTVFGLAVIYAVMLMGADPFVANFIGYAFGFSLSYALNKGWTFKNTNTIRSTLPRFVLVAGLSYLANVSVVYWAHEIGSINAYAAQAMGVPVYLAVGFIGSRYFAFSRRHR